MLPHIVPMPAGVVVYNGSTRPCDTAVGPCSCGAWHTPGCWDKNTPQQDALRLYLLDLESRSPNTNGEDA